MKGTINFYNIFMGAFDESTKSLMDYFANNIGGTAWFNVFTSYYEIRNRVSTYMSNSATLKQSLSLDSSTSSMTLSDLDIRSMLSDLLQSNELPTDFNGVYNIIFNGAFTVTSAKGVWPQNWCSYSSTFSLTDPTASGSYPAIKYAVMGNPSSTSGGAVCLVKDNRNNNQVVSYNNNPGADSMIASYVRGNRYFKLYLILL